jgi:hypothetical protein
MLAHTWLLADASTDSRSDELNGDDSWSEFHWVCQRD